MNDMKKSIRVVRALFLFAGMMCLFLMTGCEAQGTSAMYETEEHSPISFLTSDMGSTKVLRYENNGLVGMISTDLSTVIVESVYESISDFSDGLAIAKTVGGHRYLDERGNIILIIPNDGGSVTPFVDGLAMRVFDIDNINITQKYGKLSWNSLYYPPPQQVYGFIDKTGEFIISPIYYYTGTNLWVTDEGTRIVAECRGDNLWGVIDRQGNYVVEPTWLSVNNFGAEKDRLVVSDAQNRYGHIDRNGNVLIECKYERLGAFYDGATLTYAKINGKYGYIDRSGNIVVEPKYENAGVYSGGYAVAYPKYMEVVPTGVEKYNGEPGIGEPATKIFNYVILNNDGEEIYREDHLLMGLFDVLQSKQENDLSFYLKFFLEDKPQELYLFENMLIRTGDDYFDVDNPYANGELTADGLYQVVYQYPSVSVYNIIKLLEVYGESMCLEEWLPDAYDKEH